MLRKGEVGIYHTLSSAILGLHRRIKICCGMGSALWVCTSATLFHQCLITEINRSSPVTKYSPALPQLGLSSGRSFTGSERLNDVLKGYTEAVVQTLYPSLALSILTLV